MCQRPGSQLSCWRARVRLIFFFSSRRRHTRCSRDWSSDVCSSDLSSSSSTCCGGNASSGTGGLVRWRDRKSVVKGKSVDLGGRRIIKKKKAARFLQNLSELQNCIQYG